MPLETGTYISDLNASNPAHTDQLNQADSHIRLVKSTVKATFPNVTAPVTATAAQLNSAVNLTGLLGAFIGVNTDPLWLRLNGGTFLYSDFPALGTMLGFSSGVCTLPNLEDTGRFVRSVTTGLAVRATQANQNASHTHTGSVTSTGTASGATGLSSNDHAHTFTGTTAIENVNHSHTVTSTGSGTTGGQSADHTHGGVLVSSGLDPSVGTVSGPPYVGNVGSTAGTSNDHTHNFSVTVSGTTSIESAAHAHSFSGTTAGANADHAHTFSATVTSTGTFTTAAQGGTEARPESFAAIWYVHV